MDSDDSFSESARKSKNKSNTKPEAYCLDGKLKDGKSFGKYFCCVAFFDRVGLLRIWEATCSNIWELWFPHLQDKKIVPQVLLPRKSKPLWIRMLHRSTWQLEKWSTSCLFGCKNCALCLKDIVCVVDILEKVWIDKREGNTFLSIWKHTSTPFDQIWSLSSAHNRIEVDLSSLLNKDRPELFQCSLLS